MAMRMTTVRLSEPLYQELQRQAEAGGVSVAQWLREAAIAQLNFERGVNYVRLQALSDQRARSPRQSGETPDEAA
jgi:Ribbon-helix-helix protein, copG family